MPAQLQTGTLFAVQVNCIALIKVEPKRIALGLLSNSVNFPAKDGVGARRIIVPEPKYAVERSPCNCDNPGLVRLQINLKCKFIRAKIRIQVTNLRRQLRCMQHILVILDSTRIACGDNLRPRMEGWRDFAKFRNPEHHIFARPVLIGRVCDRNLEALEVRLRHATGANKHASAAHATPMNIRCIGLLE